MSGSRALQVGLRFPGLVRVAYMSGKRSEDCHRFWSSAFDYHMEQLGHPCYRPHTGSKHRHTCPRHCQQALPLWRASLESPQQDLPLLTQIWTQIPVPRLPIQRHWLQDLLRQALCMDTGFVCVHQHCVSFSPTWTCN